MSLISSFIPAFTADAAPKSAPSGSAPDSIPTAPVVEPRHQVTETAEAYGLTVELPGVDKTGLELSVDHEQIRVVGRRGWRRPAGWTPLHSETREAGYELVLEHGRVIDTAKIQAELRDGILRVALPKAEAVKPHKIAVA